MKHFAMEFDQQRGEFHSRRLRDLPLQQGEILIRVTCCTLCGSDLHTFCGRRTAPTNCVLGHEIIGTVADWSPGDVPLDFHGNPLKSGQRVTWAMAVGCGKCFYCLKNLGQKCEKLFKYGHGPGGSGLPTGGLSQLCVLVPGTQVFSIPDTLSDETASPANCATATVTAAVRLIKETHSVEGATVLIVGAGMLGLTAAAQISDAGAKNVVVVDPLDSRRHLAMSFGATHQISASAPKAVASLLASITQKRGADITLDFAGVTSAIEMCIRSVRTGGCALLAGSVFPSPKISVDPEYLVRRMLTLRGLHNYLPSDLDHALQFLARAQNRFPFEQLIEQTFPLEHTGQAFKYAKTYQPVRVAIRPEHVHL